MADKKSPAMIKQRKLLRKSTLIILLGVTIITLLTVLVVKQSPSIKDRYQAVPSTTDVLVRDLAAFKLQPDSRKYSPFVTPLSFGDKLAFEVSILRPTFIGLLVSVNQQKPAFVFYSRLPPGKNHRLDRQGERYIYIVPDSVESLRFCVIYADDKNQLQKVSSRLDLIWPSIPDSSCLFLQ